VFLHCQAKIFVLYLAGVEKIEADLMQIMKVSKLVPYSLAINTQFV